MNNTIELSDEEQKKLSHLYSHLNFLDNIEYINELLIDRYNKWKEEIRKDIMQMADDENKWDTETLYDIIHYVNI